MRFTLARNQSCDCPAQALTRIAGSPLPPGMSLRTNPPPRLRESQRDSVTQPSGCRVGEATLGLAGHSLPTPTGLQHGRVMVDATPLGLKRFSVSFPRVARAEQPWAGGRNPVGIREAGHRFLRNDKPQQLGRGEGVPSPDSLICDGNLRLSVSFALTGLTISEPPNPGLRLGLSSCAPSGLNSQHSASLVPRTPPPWISLGIGH